MNDAADDAPGARGPSRFAAFRHKGFPSYWISLVATWFAVQIQTVAVGWQVYDLTRDPFDLGLVGLSQFAPALVLVLVTGAVADRFPRRAIMAVCLSVEACCAVLLAAIVWSGETNVAFIFAILALFGTARAFYNPARQAIVPNLVPANVLASAITLNSTALNLATICGPVAGGVLYAIRPDLAYLVSATLLVGAAALVLRIPRAARREPVKNAGWEALSAGLRYIVRQKIVLGAVSLDLFVVLLGGVAALLPIYASDILEVGPAGLGILRAGPAVGAIAVSFYLVANPIRERAGAVLFASVAGFGLFTLVFALSEVFWLSLVALVLIGCCDMVSVVVRSTLVQLWTPDDLRGRVNAVNSVFVGASNELGAFRAGSMAAVLGAVPAMALGGAGALVVAALWWRWFPDLRRIRGLDRPA
jgi:MFS family permease